MTFVRYIMIKSKAMISENNNKKSS